MSGASTFLLFLRVGFSLGVVLAMIWGVARYAKRRGTIPTRGSEAHLDVMARRQLGRRGSLVVVEARGRILLVGVTDASIGLVADLTACPDAVEVGESTDSSVPTEEVVADLRGDSPRRESLMDALRDMTVRRV
ncbi:MAG: FliO/MopB family protein [Microthrixaceae bacterium]|nr:FliO/MopB family protein [Microthrixaceae bacterium]